jgi:hypothetical protein
MSNGTLSCAARLLLWERAAKLSFGVRPLDIIGIFSSHTKSRPPETIKPPRIEFIGEQAGPVEDDLKAKFRRVFAETPDVRSAYLARLAYGDPAGYSVGLCIRSRVGVNDSLQIRLGQIFTDIC